MSARPWPEEIRLKQSENILEIAFDDGAKFELSAELLRVESPSAEVKGHGPGQAVTVPEKRSVAIKQLDPVGNYALRIHFDDGHDTGLYTWEYLYELGNNRETRWADYLKRLASQGLSRDPDRPAGSGRKFRFNEDKNDLD